MPVVSYRRLKDKLYNLGVQAKLYRKSTKQVLEQLAYDHNIPLDSISLIMSRGLTVTGAQYLNTLKWADKPFNIHIRRLRDKDPP